MKLAVCVKSVPRAAALIDPRSKRVDRSGDGALNKFDAHALEEALRLKSDLAAEVVVVSMGPERASDALRTALAIGADRAVLVTDAAAVGSDLVATSRVLAAAIQREDPELVLFGQQSLDGDGAVLAAAVAERLQRPVVSQAAELSVGEGSLRARRQTEFGYDVIEAPLPAVVAVSDAINEPRHASLKGLMSAKKKPQDVLSLADLNLPASAAGEAGSGTTVLQLTEPPARIGARKVEGDENAAQTILEFLAEKELL